MPLYAYQTDVRTSRVTRFLQNLLNGWLFRLRIHVLGMKARGKETTRKTET
jgi:hypothetical protein